MAKSSQQQSKTAFRMLQLNRRQFRLQQQNATNDLLTGVTTGSCPQARFIPVVRLAAVLDKKTVLLDSYCRQDEAERLTAALTDQQLTSQQQGKDLPSACMAIRRIHQAGGLAVLAYPDRYGWCSGNAIVDNRLLTSLMRLRQAGLDGVETWEKVTPRDRQDEVAAAGQALGLILTGSSEPDGDSHPQSLLVAGALLCRADQPNQRRCLICRRRSPGRHAGLWELPGGKVEPGETVAMALRRELREELAVAAQVGPLLYVLWHDYPDTRVVLAVLDAQFDTDRLAENVHDRFLMVTPREALEQDLLPADITLFQHLADTDR